MSKPKEVSDVFEIDCIKEFGFLETLNGWYETFGISFELTYDSGIPSEPVFKFKMLK